jgi:hypothetical protein
MVASHLLLGSGVSLGVVGELLSVPVSSLDLFLAIIIAKQKEAR